MRALILLAVLALSACTVVYERPDGRPAPAQDLAECDYEASKATAGRATTAAAFDAGMLRGQCMRLRGYISKVK